MLFMELILRITKNGRIIRIVPLQIGPDE